MNIYKKKEMQRQPQMEGDRQIDWYSQGKCITDALTSELFILAFFPSCFTSANFYRKKMLCYTSFICTSELFNVCFNHLYNLGLLLGSPQWGGHTIFVYNTIVNYYIGQDILYIQYIVYREDVLNAWGQVKLW